MNTIDKTIYQYIISSLIPKDTNFLKKYKRFLSDYDSWNRGKLLESHGVERYLLACDLIKTEKRKNYK